jgi:ABC-type nitrate/sulfonate/bicarbonate transport system permease component
LVDLGSGLNRKRLRRVIQFVLGPALLIAVWWVAYAGTLVDPHLLPSPFATLADTWKNIVSGAMTRDLLQTLLRVSYAFAIAAAAGVPVGIVLGANENIYRSLEFVIDFFRSTPATAMFPLFLLLFGLGDFSKISVAAFAAWLVIVFNVAYG